MVGVSIWPKGEASRLVTSKALAETAPPPETVTVLINGEGALIATFTLAVIAG
jgi:hypothetical protein